MTCERDLALVVIISRVAAPASKLSAVCWWADITLSADLGIAAASTGEVYTALEGRQDAIEAKSAARHPERMVLSILVVRCTWEASTAPHQRSRSSTSQPPLALLAHHVGIAHQDTMLPHIPKRISPRWEGKPTGDFPRGTSQA